MFIRTENAEKINLDNSNQLYVEPLSSNEWCLLVDHKDNNKMSIIAKFDSVEKANAALISLMQAKENPYNIGWDAIEYKNKQENPVTSVTLP